MNEEKDEIGELLEEYKKQRDNVNREVPKPIAPPVRRKEVIDFAKDENQNTEEQAEESKKTKHKTVKKPQKTEEELAQIKAQKKENRDKLKNKITAVFYRAKKVILSKTMLIIVISAAVITGAVFGIRAIAQYSKTAYLKPYQDKYPDAEFSEGMLEKYCDTFGENPRSAGYIEIPDINLKCTVQKNDSDAFPKAESCTNGSEFANYVVYLENNELEKYYKNADAFNSASGYVTYTDYFNEYNFMVVGAFYTNTKAEDDDGYIFPYNVTEKMTADSTNEFISKLDSRFVYDTGVDLTRGDTFITLSCPTDYRKNYRFVVVGIARENTDNKLTAKDKDNVHYQQVIYNEKGIENPYKYSSKWYPEIIIGDKTLQKTIDDYK